MTAERVERRLAAVLAADIAGYSRLMGADEEGTLARLKAVRKSLVDSAIASHRGRIFKTTGDGMLVEFSSAVDAARCAVELQRGMSGQNIEVPQDKRIEFRVGNHVGDIIFDDDDIFGDGVNIAARLEGIAEAGGVCISDDAQRQVRGKVDFAFEPKCDIRLLPTYSVGWLVGRLSHAELRQLHCRSLTRGDWNATTRVYWPSRWRGGMAAGSRRTAIGSNAASGVAGLGTRR